MLAAVLKTLLLCVLLIASTSCHYLRGPCGLWPVEPTGGAVSTQDFSSAEGRFRFGLPGQTYTPAPDANNNTKTFKWFVLNIGQFQISYSDGEAAMDTPSGSQSIFSNFRNRLSTHGKLVADSEINLSGHTGHEFKVTTEGGTQIDRIYLAGNRMYVVSAFVPERLSCKIDSAVRVLDTFQIVDNQ